MTNFAKNNHRNRRRLFTWLATLLLVWLLISLLPITLLRWLPPPTSSFMLQNWAAKLPYVEGMPSHPNYQWVDWSSIAPAMRLAVVASEDQKFPHHHGFDTESIRNALSEYMNGGDLRGASTISQQTAKNLFLWPAQSWLRKGLEAWFTVLIELLWPKQRILEVYLNIAQFGPGIYGVEAASWVYFDQPAAMLTPEQAALLAAVLPSPGGYNVDEPSAYVLKRRDWILRQMHRLGGTAYVSNLSE